MSASSRRSLAYTDAKGNLLYRNGVVTCGRKNAPGIPLLDFVGELIRSGELSLDTLFRVNSERFHHMPASIRRAVTVYSGPQALTILPEDVAALKRRLAKHRVGEKHYLSEYVADAVVLIPTELHELLTDVDWDILSAAGNRQRVNSPEVKNVLARYFPDRVVSWDSDDRLDEFWNELPNRIVAAYEGDDIMGDEKLRKGERPHRCAVSVLHVIRGAASVSLDRASGFFVQNRDRIIAAIDWYLALEDYWNLEYPLHALAVFDREYAERSLQALWPKYREFLIGWRKKAHKLLRRQIEQDHSENGWTSIYFDNLRRVHNILPELAEEVSDPEDWLLLTAELEHWRSRGDDVFHVAHLRRMKELEPVYARFFPG